MSSCRKVGKSAGQRRRSPRISALDNRQNLDDALPPLSKLGKQVWKGRESPQNGDCVEWRSLKENQNHDGFDDDDEDEDVVINSNGLVMPAKHILELVLDTLQRRDTYEIFAQPVDPNEVDDYYDIIKEPMDFGTMRAKLHEGMYENLQEFEHDVFLIPENAMHFNSSTTTYYRQARAIHDLANKVFHVLKTNPQNFVTEFSGTRRRSMRKALSDSIAKPTSTSSTFQIRTRKSPGFHFGGGDGRVSDSQVAYRRETYLCKKEDPSSSKALVVLQGDIRYEDSLMWYVKDLGPTAQRVAKRKLLGQHESDNRRQPKQFKTFRDFAPPAAGCNPFAKASNGESRNGRKEKTAEGNKVTAVVRSRPVILALESCHSEFKSRNKKSCNALIKPICDEAAAPQKPLPLISHFTFDLPFLKARLEQMKAVEETGLKRKAGLSIYQ